MRWITFVLTVSVLCLGPNVVAMYSSTAVTELTPSNFESKLKSGVWMVEFYAPWYVVVVGSALVELLVSVCVVLNITLSYAFSITGAGVVIVSN